MVNERCVKMADRASVEGAERKAWEYKRDGDELMARVAAGVKELRDVDPLEAIQEIVNSWETFESCVDYADDNSTSMQYGRLMWARGAYAFDGPTHYLGLFPPHTESSLKGAEVLAEYLRTIRNNAQKQWRRLRYLAVNARAEEVMRAARGARSGVVVNEADIESLNRILGGLEALISECPGLSVGMKAGLLSDMATARSGLARLMPNVHGLVGLGRCLAEVVDKVLFDLPWPKMDELSRMVMDFNKLVLGLMTSAVLLGSVAHRTLAPGEAGAIGSAVVEVVRGVLPAAETEPGSCVEGGQRQ